LIDPSAVIDPRAVIDPKAEIAADVEIGPYSIIGPDVKVGPGCWIGPHVVVRGPTVIGRENRIFQFSSIGDDPQDKKYAGEPTRLEIGDRNLIREHCTINRGSEQGGGVTRIGDDNWIMVGVHVAHDCIVGNSTIFANNVALAGHVRVDDFAILGGYTLVHQFCILGAHCFTAMGSVIPKDVPPYVMVSGHMARPYGLNSEGLRRRGFDGQTRQEITRAYKVIYKSGLTLPSAIERLDDMVRDVPEIEPLLSFLKESKRGIVR